MKGLFKTVFPCTVFRKDILQKSKLVFPNKVSSKLCQWRGSVSINRSTIFDPDEYLLSCCTMGHCRVTALGIECVGV